MNVYFTLFFLVSTSLFAQHKKSRLPTRSTPVVAEQVLVVENQYEEIDKQIRADTTQQTIQQLADRFQSFSTETAKVRAIYGWITKNIAYDANQLFSFNLGEASQLSTAQILRARKGVCVDYALLFDELCTKLGIKAYVIEGYAKVGKSVSDFGHAWNAARIDGKWYLFDATWGAGHVSGQTFKQAPSDVFFMVDPNEFIYTHMPFDPLWQFLDYPITNQEFYQNKTSSADKTVVFHTNDSLSVYDKQDRLNRLQVAEKRIEKNGNVNNMTYVYLRDVKSEIKATYFNRAIDAYNLTVKLLKEFINYRIAKFIPLKSDEMIKKMLVDARNQLSDTKKRTAEIPSTYKDIAEKVAEINKSIVDLEVTLKEQDDFLKRYFTVWKPMRKAMF